LCSREVTFITMVYARTSLAALVTAAALVAGLVAAVPAGATTTTTTPASAKKVITAAINATVPSAAGVQIVTRPVPFTCPWTHGCGGAVSAWPYLERATFTADVHGAGSKKSDEVETRFVGNLTYRNLVVEPLTSDERVGGDADGRFDLGAAWSRQNGRPSSPVWRSTMRGVLANSLSPVLNDVRKVTVTRSGSQQRYVLSGITKMEQGKSNAFQVTVTIVNSRISTVTWRPGTSGTSGTATLNVKGFTSAVIAPTGSILDRDALWDSYGYRFYTARPVARKVAAEVFNEARARALSQGRSEFSYSDLSAAVSKLGKDPRQFSMVVFYGKSRLQFDGEINRVMMTVCAFRRPANLGPMGTAVTTSVSSTSDQDEVLAVLVEECTGTKVG
jgi:hypothetical protein